MLKAIHLIRYRFDGAGVMLSGLCALHCVLSIVLVSVLGLGSQALLAPAVHEVGLALAVVIGLVALGIGVGRHRRAGPLLVGSVGLALMGTALGAPHGMIEAVLTIAGVALVAAAHIANLRRSA